MKNAKPTRDAGWRAVARECGGEVIEDRRGRVKQIRFAHDPFSILLDTHTVSTGSSSTTYTRARTHAPMRTPFRFTLYRENAFTRIGTLLGMQDLRAGQPEIDRRFIVKSDNESMVRSVLIDPTVYRPLLALDGGRFELMKYRGRFGHRPQGIAELRFQVSTVIKEPVRLGEMVELMRGALDLLVRIGAISPEPVEQPR